jgi:hypothetical protein
MENFTLMLLSDVSRSLFSKDKFLFISAAAFAILAQEGAIAASDLSALISCQSLMSSAAAAKPDAAAWMTSKMWEDLVAVSVSMFDSTDKSTIATSSSSSSAAAAARLTSASFLASFSSNAAAWQAW